MAKKNKNTIPSGFDDILGNIYSNAEQHEETSNMDDLLQPDTPLVEVEEEKNNEPPVNNTEDGKETKDDTLSSNANDDSSEIPDNVIDNKSTADDDDTHEDNNDPTEEALIEAQQVGLLFDTIGQSFGWNMDDIEENDRPLTVDDLTKYLVDVVEQNSVPKYSDERIQKLDEYVKNGGKFEDFYQKQSTNLSLDNIDMEDESNQKAVIRELLKYSNYSDEQINKKINRYEDADMLYEESEDALDRLKQIKKAELEDIQRQQDEYARQQEEQSKAIQK